MIRCDPGLEDELDHFASDHHDLTFDDFSSWAEQKQWEIVDGADNHVLPSDTALPSDNALPSDTALPSLAPAGRQQNQDITAVALDGNQAADRARIQALIDASDPDDVEEAEIDIDELDPTIVGLADPSGQLVAFASAAPWELDESFDDIGVLTHPNHRGLGLGRMAVSNLIIETIRQGRSPLYRCNWSRPASKRLCAGLGFETVGRLLAITPK